MKKILTLLTLLIFGVQLMAQPVNDDCSGLIDLGEAPICPIPDTFTNVDATMSVVFSNPAENIPACFTGGVVDRDVWFSFTVPSDGSIIDFTVVVTGVDGPNGSILQPQVAIYRGDCLLDELQELDCATSAPGETAVELDLVGLTPGLPYFLRISDWSASASPNWGDFELCVKEYEPVFNMGEETFTSACAGTLYDSGGPDGDYSSNENLTFTICPDDFHQCIFINVNSFNLENNFDFLNFFAGDDITAPMINDLTGSGSNVEIQVLSNCVTIQFDSDISVADEGFELTWVCSPDTCTIPPPITCDNSVEVPSLPFVSTGLTTCNAGDNYGSSPCNNDVWMDTDDYIFTYTSPGEECIAVSITGSNPGTGVAVFNDCPNLATDCLAQSGGGAGQMDPMINAVFLEQPGTYYIVVDNANACTPFNIEVQQVSCPVVLPSAALCEDALSLNGCGQLPAVISVAPGQGDANFINEGVNDGCWGGFTPNFTWFFFQAQTDGEFGFVMQAADPNEASDIDFQVWGPIEDPDDLCDFAFQNQPIRSSYAAGADPTGLSNVNPVTGVTVTDTCETAAGDDFVTTIPVQTGEFYVVLVNDWGNQIVSGAVSIDFTGTTQGVLDAVGIDFQVSADTALCPGESAQLFANGGEIYQWFPEDGLSCIFCPNPVATISESTVYSVAINTVCVVDTLEVQVGLLQVDAGPDLTVCTGEEIQIVAGANFTGVTYQWNDPAGFLSCTDCPDPVVSANTSGTFNFEVTVAGPTCSFSDAMTLTVLPGTAPAYDISDDQALCFGETIPLGGQPTPGVTYNWTSDPPGFVSNEANPAVTPTETTTFYLETSSSACPLSSFDSVFVSVAELPVIDVAPDTLICQGEPVSLGFTQPEPGVTYAWSPVNNLDNPNSPNPLATPNQTTQYTLTADRNGCSTEATVTVEVTQISIDILSPDTIPICKGENVPIQATVFPVGTNVTWTPGDGSLNTTTGLSVVATPQTATSYIATVEIPGCVKMDTVYIGVDSLPYDMAIMPADTQICQGEMVLLMSPTYEPANFSQITFQWIGGGQLTPDSLYNMVAQPGQTTVYQRIATNGFCSDTVEATVTVVPVESISVEPMQSEICQGQSIQLTVVSDNPAITEFTWEPSQGLSCSDCPNPLASPVVTTTYTVEAEFEGCPVGASATVSVIAGPGVELPDDTGICPGEEVQLNNFNDPNTTYSWTSSDESLVSDEAQPVVSPSQTTTYFLTAIRGACEIMEEVTLVVSEDFELEVANDTIVCPGSSVQLTGSASEPGINLVWTNENGAVQLGLPPSVVANQSGVFYATATDPAGCFTHVDSIFIDTYEDFAIDEIIYLEADTTNELFEGEEITLEVLTVPTPLAGATYEWFLEGELIGTSEGPSFGPVNVPEIETEAENFVYTVLITDANGCFELDDRPVPVLENPFEIPNVFTPNNDQTNDNFLPISKVPVDILEFQVWNRWGQLVYDNENGNDGWNGLQNGDPAPADVYIYLVKWRISGGSGKTYVKKGDVTLLR